MSARVAGSDGDDADVCTEVVEQAAQVVIVRHDQRNVTLAKGAWRGDGDRRVDDVGRTQPPENSPAARAKWLSSPTS